MDLPPVFLESLKNIKGFDKEAFIKVHESGEQVTSIRLNPFKKSKIQNPTSKIPWTDYGYYLNTRPSFTFDPLFHAGCYYVQEASSMFLEQVLKQTVDLAAPLRVLDLSAAPGGKSTHLLSLISKNSLLVSNEVIRSRANILNDNIVKWGCSNTIVTNNDPKDFQRLENYFDVIVVDAPCSGSGLFRREPEAIGEWNEQNVALCSQRQQRILADVLPALRDKGVLIYSTCSYSKEEDELIVDWLRNELISNDSRMESIGEELMIDPEWNIIPTDGAYRFWPDKLKGEGFFIACFRKKGKDAKEPKLPRSKPGKFSQHELDILKNYVNIEGLTFLRHGKMLRAIPGSLLSEISFISTKFRVVNCGTEIGQIIKDKLVPEHGLAMSNILSDDVPRIELSYDQSIQYLKKKELELLTDKKGWNVVSFESHPLGWVNILSNRINNYYPKELRILKD
jgi:16S rRNA C967 or C1407 C5-methylase (RsmB/RsmF family)/NOL1/NOP2/fmu family ribosome biogenesis protein